jgi:4-amino-4-deoxy-L-arabinose transferase-like glycosyltransferase
MYFENISTKENNNYYLYIGTISLLLSVLWILFINTVPFSDFDYYYNLAKQIANGGKWGDTYTSVGYAIVLGGVFKLFGASIMLGKVFNIVLTLLNNVIFYNILNAVNLNRRDKKIIFTMFVLFPNNIFYNSILCTEILFTSILLLTTLVYFKNIKYKYIIIGILTGINSLVKPFFIVIFFGIFLVELIKNKKFSKAVINSIIVLLVTLITIAPWVYRNTKYIGQFTFISNNGGIVLYINNNSTNTMGRWMPSDNVENSITVTDKYKSSNRTQQNKMLSQAAKKWITSNPKRFLQLGFKRLYNTYYLGDDIGYSTYGSGLSSKVSHKLFNIANTIRNIIFIPGTIGVLAYSLYIIAMIFKNKTQNLNVYSLFFLILYYMNTCVYFITEGQSRYSFPIIFVMIYFFYFTMKNSFRYFINKENLL